MKRQEEERDPTYRIDPVRISQEIKDIWDKHPRLTMRTTKDILYMAENEGISGSHILEALHKRGRRSVLHALRSALETMPGVTMSGTSNNPLWVRK